VGALEEHGDLEVRLVVVLHAPSSPSSAQSSPRGTTASVRCRIMRRRSAGGELREAGVRRAEDSDPADSIPSLISRAM